MRTVGRKKGSIPWNKGKKETRPEVLEKLSISHLGQKSWNKGNIGYRSGIRRLPEGFKHTEETKRKMSDSHPKKEQSYQWTGDEAKYSAKHMWVVKKWGKAKTCVNDLCSGVSSTYHWANLSGNYKREDKSDWAELCASCHKKFDTFGYQISIGGKLI